MLSELRFLALRQLDRRLHRPRPQADGHADRLAARRGDTAVELAELVELGGDALELAAQDLEGCARQLAELEREIAAGAVELRRKEVLDRTLSVAAPDRPVGTQPRVAR